VLPLNLTFNPHTEQEDWSKLQTWREREALRINLSYPWWFRKLNAIFHLDDSVEFYSKECHSSFLDPYSVPAYAYEDRNKRDRNRRDTGNSQSRAFKSIHQE
jgi:hypothetical protein